MMGWQQFKNAVEKHGREVRPKPEIYTPRPSNLNGVALRPPPRPAPRERNGDEDEKVRSSMQQL